MPHLVPEENQKDITRIALRLYAEDQQGEEKDRQQAAVRSAFEEMQIPTIYLERAAEILEEEKAAQTKQRQRRSRKVGILAGTALGVPFTGLLLCLLIPQVKSTIAWWRTPTLTAQQTGTLLGKWQKTTDETPVADLRDATLEFFPNGNVILETPQKTVASGSYAVDEKQVTTFTFPAYRGKVLSSSAQELRLLLHYNTYRIWGTKSGEAESVLTYQREAPRPWEQTLALWLLVGGSGIVGLSAMVKGAAIATEGTLKKSVRTYFGFSTGLVTIALLARYTGQFWAGGPLSAAYLGYCYGFLGKRLQDQLPPPEPPLTED